MGECVTIHQIKLRRLNWLRAKFWLKSDSSSFNQLFGPKYVVRFTLQPIWLKSVQILMKSSILIEKSRNQLEMVEFNRKWSRSISFQLISTFSIFNWLFQSFNWLFQSQYFDQNRLKIDQKLSNLDQNCDRRLNSVVGFLIGPKWTIEISWFGIGIVDHSMPDP